VKPRVSIVIPVYNEGDAVVHVFRRIADAVTLPYEVFTVYDSPEDTTAAVVKAYGDDRYQGVLNDVAPGPAGAMKAGIAHARAEVVVVTMADGSDDASQIDTMTRLVERGCAVAAASRYMSGGAQVGGPLVKSTLSRTAGLLLCWFARVGTHDATNSFKAYSREFVEAVGIDSDGGFELGIELVAKARRLRKPVAEVPTIWLDRSFGSSRFQMRPWLPRYLRWFFFAFGPALSVEEVRAQTTAGMGTNHR
jgi:glycosyltransferase involved in cell wall biosynthesis